MEVGLASDEFIVVWNLSFWNYFKFVDTQYTIQYKNDMVKFVTLYSVIQGQFPMIWYFIFLLLSNAIVTKINQLFHSILNNNQA